MSNESSVSETTPLRRPESENILTTSSAAKTPAFINVANNDEPSSVSQAGEQPTVAIVNDRNIEVQLLEQQHHQHSDNIIMDTNKRILFRVGIDVLILLCVGLPILFFHLWGTAYKRGFFCDDESLKHPFKESTVPTWMLYIIGLVIPIGVMFILEFVHCRQNARSFNANHKVRKYVFMDYEIPEWLVECYKKIGIFGFGAAVSQLTTDIAKYSIGRLRPHFFEVCQPLIAGNKTCNDASMAGKYIQDFTCQGNGYSARILKDVRLSFPSGHSSFTFYTMVYVSLYLQARMTWRGSKLLRHFLQFLFIMIAWYTALSRVSDYKHHWSDVLAGSTLGALIAIIVAKYVSDLFLEQPSSKNLSRSSQDTTTTPQTITIS